MVDEEDLLEDFKSRKSIYTEIYSLIDGGYILHHHISIIISSHHRSFIWKEFSDSLCSSVTDFASDLKRSYTLEEVNYDNDLTEIR